MSVPNLRVLYVGKTDWYFSYRFLEHFPDQLGGEPVKPERWPERPAFLVTVCDPDLRNLYRIASLEAYLIDRLAPPVNRQGQHRELSPAQEQAQIEGVPP